MEKSCQNKLTLIGEGLGVDGVAGVEVAVVIVVVIVQVVGVVIFFANKKMAVDHK